MGVAYFIVLDNKNPGFETFVNGKAIAHARESIDAITEKLGLRRIDELMSFGRLDDEFDVPDEYREVETPWFEPGEGIEWIGAIRRHIESNSSSVKEPVRVMKDLEEYEQVLKKAVTIGAKWHFEMDF